MSSLIITGAFLPGIRAVQITILIFFAIILYYIENSFFVINQFTTLFTASHVYFNYIKRMDFGLT